MRHSVRPPVSRVASKRAMALMDAFSGKLFRRVSLASLSLFHPLPRPSQSRPRFLHDRRAAAASIYGRVITRTATGVQGRIGFRGRAEGDHSRALHAEGNDRLNDDGSSTEMQAKSSTDN